VEIYHLPAENLHIIHLREQQPPPYRLLQPPFYGAEIRGKISITR